MKSEIFCFNLESWLNGKNDTLYFIGDSRTGKSTFSKKLKYFSGIKDIEIIEDFQISDFSLNEEEKIKGIKYIACSNLCVEYCHLDLKVDSIIFFCHIPFYKFIFTIFHRFEYKETFMQYLRLYKFNLYEKQLRRYYKNESKIFGKPVFDLQQLFAEIQAYIHR